MSKLTDSVQGVAVSGETMGLISAHRELNGLTDRVVAIVGRVWGDGIDDAIEPFILSVVEAQDELTRLIALNITQSLTSGGAVI